MAEIKRCTCANEWQDKKYGNGMRVHNVTQQSKPASQQGLRCTVCGTEK